MSKIFQNPIELAVALNATETNNVVLRWTRRAENSQLPCCLMNAVFKYCFKLVDDEVKVVQDAALSFLLMVIPTKRNVTTNYTNWIVSSKLLSECLFEIGCDSIFEANVMLRNEIETRSGRDLNVALGSNDMWSIQALLQVVRQCYLDPLIWMESLRAQNEW